MYLKILSMIKTAIPVREAAAAMADRLENLFQDEMETTGQKANEHAYDVGYEDGVVDGKAEGHEEGYEEGYAVGLEEGDQNPYNYI